MFRFTIRDMLWLTVVVGMGCAASLIGCNQTLPQPDAKNDEGPLPMNEPTDAVKEFIGAHHAWNIAAWDRSQKMGRDNQEATEIATKEYGELIARWCAPSV